MYHGAGGARIPRFGKCNFRHPPPSHKQLRPLKLSSRYSMENFMSTPQEKPIRFYDDEVGGDYSLWPDELHLWAICLSVQRTFDAEVIFIRQAADYRTKSNDTVKFLVPRGHPRIADIIPYMIKALKPLRRELEALLPPPRGRWRPCVDISLWGYSGVVGARAFRSAADAIVNASYPNIADDRIIYKMAHEEGCKAAWRIKSVH